MIEQQGRVLSVDGGRASITFESVSGCPACDAGKGCGAGVFGRLVRRKPTVLVLDSQPWLQPGQAVIVGIPETYFLRLLAKLYFVPLLAGLAGAGLGHYLGVFWSLQGFALDLMALAGAFILAVVTTHFQSAGKDSQSDDGMANNSVHILRVPAAAKPEESSQYCRSDRLNF